MPTYEYECTSCGQHIEVFQRISEDPLTTCGVCGGTLRKVFHPVGIVFKGSGFYATDSREKAAAAGSSKDADGGPSKDAERGSSKDAERGSSKDAERGSGGDSSATGRGAKDSKGSKGSAGSAGSRAGTKEPSSS